MGSNVSAKSAAVSKKESIRKQMELAIYSLKITIINKNYFIPDPFVETVFLCKMASRSSFIFRLVLYSVFSFFKKCCRSVKDHSLLCYLRGSVESISLKNYIYSLSYRKQFFKNNDKFIFRISMGIHGICHAWKFTGYVRIESLRAPSTLKCFCQA